MQTTIDQRQQTVPEHNGQPAPSRPDFGLFAKAHNQTAYLKAGLLGFAGSGKTYTSALMAKGIVERLQTTKPVFFLDTETGSDFMVPFFQEWGIELYVSKSRAFTDLLEGVRAAEQHASVLIIDSISHFWKEVQDSYKKSKHRNRLHFQDWGLIKDQWGRFTDCYINSQVHIIMCGRAGYEYAYFEDEDGKKQLEKTGTKMKAETEMGYEPSLLMEMVKEPTKDKTSVHGALWNHVAYVLKDRSTRLEGKKFIDPTFEDFLPMFDFLNIGSNHVGIQTDRDSRILFERDSDQNSFERKRKRAILIEEIQGLLQSVFPGQSAEEKRKRVDLMFEAFGTRSWTALEDFDVDRLRHGLEQMKGKLMAVST